MQRPHVLLFTLAALLLAGAMAGLGIAYAHDEKQEIHVPVGRVGDQVERVVLSDRPDRPGPGEAPEPLLEGGWSVRGSESCTMALGQSLDRFARPVDAMLQSCEQRSAYQVVRQEGASLSSAPAEYRLWVDNLTEAIGLATREPVRVDDPRGPEEADLTTHFEPDEGRISAGAFQGRSLRVGEQLKPSTPLTRHSHWMVGDPNRTRQHSAMEAGSILLRQWVGEVGKINSERAVAVHSNITVWSPSATPVAYEERVAWFTDDCPYPVLEDHVLRDANGRESPRVWRTVLTTYRPGSGPLLPWDQGEVGASPIRRGDGGTAGLQDGEGPRLPLSLEDASSAAELSEAENNWTAWRDAHETARLWAAEYSLANDSIPQWGLLYAELAGDAREVRVASEATGLSVTDGGHRDVRVIDQPRVGLVTIASAENAWRAMLGPAHTGLPVNHIQWSARLDPFPSLTPGINGATLASPWRLEIGNVAQDGATSVLELDAENGELVRYDETRAGRSENAADWQARTSIPDPLATLPTDFKLPVLAAWTSASAAALLLSVYFYPLLRFASTKGLLSFAAYTRLLKDRLLDQRVRDALMEAVRADPGVNAAELRRRTGVGWGTVVYHLGVLERHKLLSSLVDGRDRRFFPVGFADWSHRGRWALLQHAQTRGILELVRQAPGVHAAEVAARAGLSRPTTAWHLNRLSEAGLVGRVRQGRRFAYFVNASATEATPGPSAQNG